MSPDAKRCDRCLRDKKACDGVAVASSLSRVLQIQRKLEGEEDQAEEDVIALQQGMVPLQEEMNRLQRDLGEALLRLQRIRRMKRNVRSHGQELAERGMVEIDREDGLLPALDGHEDALSSELATMGVPPDVDGSSVGGVPDDGAHVSAEHHPSVSAT